MCFSTSVLGLIRFLIVDSNNLTPKLKCGKPFLDRQIELEIQLEIDICNTRSDKLANTEDYGGGLNIDC